MKKKLDTKTINGYFIGYSKKSRGYKFYDPTIRSIFQDVEFAEGDKVKDFVFEEECVTIPTITIDNDQISIPNIVQEVNLDQDNVGEPSV